MTTPLPDRLGAALTRLSSALHHLESAAERRAESEAGRADLDEEFMLLQEDRSRLAGELDTALARGRALVSANAEVATRLDRATDTVRAVLAQFDPADADSPADDADSLPARRVGRGRGE